MIKEDQMHQLTNSLYQISTIINAILKIIDISSNQTHFPFTPANTILVLEILSLLLPKSSTILADFNISQKLLHFLEVHLNHLIHSKELFTYRNGWQKIEKSEQSGLISSGLKLLCQPFVRKNASMHSLSAPTYARNIADS